MTTSPSQAESTTPESAHADTKSDVAAAIVPAKDAGGARREEPPVAKSVGEATAIQLKIAIPLATLLAGAAFMVGSAVSPRGATNPDPATSMELAQAKAEAQRDREQLQSIAAIVHDQTDNVVRNLDMSDKAVHDWIRVFADDLKGYDLSPLLNTRGFRIYKAEQEIAFKNDNRYRRNEIRRALDWFMDSSLANANNPWSAWNAACMHALLGDADLSVELLKKMDAIAAATDREKFRQRVCTDNDFCPIAAASSFQAYMSTVDCTSLVRVCPTPPISVR
jgi:hypothetical protein